jgi:F0F1-type ATP synthase delta subunit
LFEQALSLCDSEKQVAKLFRKRDPEGKFLLNLILLNGHDQMLAYVLENFKEAMRDLPLTLEGKTTVLH